MINSKFNYEDYKCKLIKTNSNSKKLLEFCQKNGVIIYPPDSYEITDITCTKNCSTLLARDILEYTNLKSISLNYNDVGYAGVQEGLLNGKITYF